MYVRFLDTFDPPLTILLNKAYVAMGSMSLHNPKVRPPIEFLNVGVANPLTTQMLLSDNFLDPERLAKGIFRSHFFFRPYVCPSTNFAKFIFFGKL